MSPYAQTDEHMRATHVRHTRVRHPGNVMLSGLRGAPHKTDPSSTSVRRPVRHAVVCVPAKNEAQRLPAFFDAMSEAVISALMAGIDCRIVIALDGCTDDSHAIIAALTLNFICPVHPVLLPAFGTPHAGRARKAALDGGLEQIDPMERNACALLTTDADTLVDADWICASAHALEKTDLVAGWVDWDDEVAIDDLIVQEAYFDDLHRYRRTLDPVPFDAEDPHHKMYGASLGVRANAYAAVGGLPERRSSEDVALTRAIRLSGLRMRQDRKVRVLTSTRRSGRASGGFSDAIISDAHRRECGGLMMVDDPRYLTKCYRASSRLRAAFEASRAGAETVRSQECVESVVEGVGTAVLDFEFEQAWASSPSADAFVTRLLDPVPVPAKSGGIPKVPLEQARALLDELKEEGGK